MLTWLAQAAVALYAHGFRCVQKRTALSKKEIVYEVLMDFVYPEVEITDTQCLETDLQLDKLDRLNIVMSLEETLGKELPDDLIENKETTVYDIIRSVIQ